MADRDRAWQDNPEQLDYPTAEDMRLELADADDGDINELVDSPPNEDGRLHQYAEDLLSGPEPDHGNPYHGTENDDPSFYSDEPY